MASITPFRERLNRTATATRDLIVHGDADRWEVFVKASTLRETTRDHVARKQAVEVEETGVAVRSYHRGKAGFAAASGLEVDASRRAVDGALSTAEPLDFDPLPPMRLLGTTAPPEAAQPPPTGWADTVVEEISRAVERRSDGRMALRHSVFQEGTFSWLLTTAEGFVSAHEGTTTSLLAEASIEGAAQGVWREWIHIPGAETFDVEMAAAQICDRALLGVGSPCSNDGLWDVILHSEVTTQLVTALVPLFLARPGSDDPLEGLLNRDGQLTGEDLTLIDDRLGPGVPVAGPCDGEGLPASRTLLLDHGVPRHRLASFRDAVLAGEMPRGGAVRLSYRDYPTSGVGNLRVATDLGVSPAELLRRAPRSLFLLRPLAPILVRATEDDYRILASGVWIVGGQIEGPQPVVELRGSVGQLLRRLDGVGTDLSWRQTEAGLVGAPSMLIRRQRIVG